jgi:hypothetical protein
MAMKYACVNCGLQHSDRWCPKCGYAREQKEPRKLADAHLVHCPTCKCLSASSLRDRCDNGHVAFPTKLVILALCLTGCIAAPFSTLEATEGDAGSPEVGARDSGLPEPDATHDAGVRDVGSDAPTAPTDCPHLEPPAFEVWTVYADGGFAPQPGGDCQGAQLAASDAYSCESVVRDWMCPWQSAGKPSILIWCRSGNPIIVGCQMP